jgi:2-C-methyl-D-erythritol 2,4-cyclodiphosphate synthase
MMNSLRRAIDRLALYLPAILMAIFALGSWWLVRSLPTFFNDATPKPVRQEPDYYLKSFSVKSFDSNGQLTRELSGDQAQHFPDTDATYKGADSAKLLKIAYDHVKQLGWQLGNVDCTIVAQAPKLAPHRSDIRSSIAKALGVTESQVNVKAKTAEKMGPVGEGLSMEARAVVLIHKP